LIYFTEDRFAAAVGLKAQFIDRAVKVVSRETGLASQEFDLADATVRVTG